MNTDNNSQQKSTGPAFLRVILVFLGIYVCVHLVYYYIMYTSADTSTPYTKADMLYKLTTTDSVFDVTVEDIRKEKNKEDMYTVMFKEIGGSLIRFKKTMTKADFEIIIGEGNNTLSSRVYTLEYIIKDRKPTGTRTVALYNLTMRRLHSFGQFAFSESEVSKLSSELLDYVNAVRVGENKHMDYEELSRASNSEAVTLQEVEWYNFKSSDLKPVPTIAVEDTEGKEEDIPNIDIHDNKADNATETWVRQGVKMFIRREIVLC